MKEIICLLLGQCGNAIGSKFWEILCLDHGINEEGSYVGKNPDQLEMISAYFNETQGLVYSPRSVMIDLDRTSIEAVRTSPYGRIFNDKNFLFGKENSGNNWAKGHFTEGAQLCNTALNIIRREVEACDCFHGFQLSHSIGGGTGAGLGSLLLNKLRDEYPNATLSVYSIVPSPKVSNCTVEQYNAILTFNHLIESSHHTFCIDNEALYNIALDTLKLNRPSFNNLNHMISSAMSGVSACMRFQGPSNTSLRKISFNMVPFPRLHFFIPGFAPLLCKTSKAYRKFTVLEITSDLINYNNLFTAYSPKLGKFLTTALIFRGEATIKEVELQMSLLRNKDSPRFVEWIPDNINTSICNVPSPGVSTTATFIGNSTSIRMLFSRVKEQYQCLFQRKAFIHWFTGEGMEEMEFSAAEANLSDLISEYNECEVSKLEKYFQKCHT